MTENNNEPQDKDTVADWAEELGIESNVVEPTEEATEEVAAEVTEDVLEELDSVKKAPIFEMPSFSTGFRGFDKTEVESFLKSILKAYNEVANKENVDSSVMINANKVIKANVKKIESLEKKVVSLEKNKDESATRKLIEAAEKKAALILAKAEADVKKHQTGLAKLEADAKAKASKIESAATVKANKIVDAANAKAIKALEKAVADAKKIVENGKNEIIESRRVLASTKDANERLIALYTTQIKTLKEQNRKNTK
jgi:cell division septum initiation protein DivIVA